MSFNRYDIHWVDLDPVRGSELAKTRPAIIISMDVLNRAIETVVICPLTSKLHSSWRSRLQVKVAGRDAEIAVDQIRAVSKTRIGKKVGSLSTADAAALCQLIREMYGEE
jgi:mRNA interferase MazF